MMAQSKCPGCGATRFEMVHANNLEGAGRSVLFVQCAECGIVVGVLDFVNFGVQAAKFKDDVDRVVEGIKRNFQTGLGL